MANITILEALQLSLNATKKYVDDKVAEANASGGYTHPDSHPASMITGLATVATSGSYNDLTNKPTIPSIEGLATETYVNNKLSSMPKSLAGHDGAQVLSYIDKHNILERENMIDKAFQVFTSLFYSTSIPASGDISNLSVNVVDFVNTIMNACTEFGEDIFLYFDFIFDSPIKFVVMPYSSNNMFAMIIDDGMTRVGLQIEFTGDGTGEYTKTSTELVTSNEIATVATSGSYNDLTDKPTIPDVSDKANISGQVFTGAIEAPTVIASTYFRTPALVGEGDNSAYYHRVNFGYQNHDYWEFHEYGGDYRFYENKNGTAAGGTMIANIKSTYSDFKGEVRENGTRVYSPNNKPTADDLGITIPSIDGLATETYVNNKVAGLVDSAPEALNTLNELATALGNDANFATTISNQIGLKANSADLATVATSGSYNDLSDKPTIPAAYTHPASHPASIITGLHTVATSGDYNDLNNKPSIPTVTNDLTNKLKANYDAAYTHSTSAHAPSNAQKNSDITKAEIEAKLTGNITTHTHSQYLTSIPSEYITEQELTSKGYATESQINSAIEAAATTHEEVKTTVNQILGGAYIE